MKQGTAVIIGAGPAGLTAALELQRRTGIKPIVIEAGQDIGGISRTVRYKGNRMDIGGHRFFSKSARVMRWWLDLMPAAIATTMTPPGGRDMPTGGTDSEPDEGPEDLVMLVRQRRSRIYFSRKLFDYPLQLSMKTCKKMGMVRTIAVGVSYLRSVLFPRRSERSLEDFLINRFGLTLYLTFFKPYTEKVWGVPCDQISSEWGSQRIKGLSLSGVAAHFLGKALRRRGSGDIAQRTTETSLIETFLYPKFGPGQLWEHVADLVGKSGGEVHLGTKIDRINMSANKVVSVEGVNLKGERIIYPGDFFFSTMPVRDLVRALSAPVPDEVKNVSEGLLYRDFVTVGLLVKKLALTEKDGSRLKDNWVYIQEPDVLVGRLQIFNNWSPWLVNDDDKVWMGLEYFCNDNDPLWSLSDEAMTQFAVAEIVKLSIIHAADIEDSHVVRVAKTYPAYFGTYDRFDVIRNFTDKIENLFLVGRNGMHKYNNQDHSMLTAMTAVDNIASGTITKDNLWAINTETEYHEEKAAG